MLHFALEGSINRFYFLSTGREYEDYGNVEGIDDNDACYKFDDEYAEEENGSYNADYEIKYASLVN